MLFLQDDINEAKMKSSESKEMLSDKLSLNKSFQNVLERKISGNFGKFNDKISKKIGYLFYFSL